MVFVGLAVISLFVPFFGAFLFWNFLLLSASLSVLGFLEINSGKTWFSNITWLVSLSLLITLFIMAFASFENSQIIYYYAAFSIIVPILLMITALISKNSPVWKSLLPLLIPAIFIVSSIFFSQSTAYPPLLLLSIGWGILGMLNYLESKEN